MDTSYNILMFDWKETDEIIEQLIIAANERKYIYETTDCLNNDSRAFVISDKELTQTQAINKTQEYLEEIEGAE